ncbi:proline-rich receptor-like protein kinase PERK12 [Iris pallida]|uniref:Proline-rich receptor-like protein kinase PERK12 n=1 Tax=Iris pallida TaxID=29817 RepID=A0AAX6ETE4_IRIPA|nr:proline-rich receptor-like protein kinase PERK12 [Iris pallida]
MESLIIFPSRSHDVLIIQGTFYIYYLMVTKFCSGEGLQPRSLFGLRVVTRLPNSSQVILYIHIHYRPLLYSHHDIYSQLILSCISLYCLL